jgi:hypothetical protein
MPNKTIHYFSAILNLETKINSPATDYTDTHGFFYSIHANLWQKILDLELLTIFWETTLDPRLLADIIHL